MIREKGAAIERKTSERCTIEMREVGRVTVDRGGWEVGGRGGGVKGRGKFREEGREELISTIQPPSRQDRGALPEARRSSPRSTIHY